MLTVILISVLVSAFLGAVISIVGIQFNIPWYIYIPVAGVVGWFVPQVLYLLGAI